jgi:hypothetical protein
MGEAMPATSLRDPLVGDAADLERGAFNAAFYELGLHVYWDKDTYRKVVAANSSEHDCVRGYLEREQAHLLRAYEADFLADLVIRTKQRCRELLAVTGPSAFPEGNWTEKQWQEAGF